MISFIVALKSEANSILDLMQIEKQFNLLDKPTYVGKLFGVDCSISISGIGKVSAALTTQKAIDEFKPSCIVNFGTCGGNNNSVNITDIYSVDESCQFDFDITAIDDVPLCYIQEYDTVFFKSKYAKCFPKARLATADRFSSAVIDHENIVKLGCGVRDMEGCAIAQVCTSNKMPLYLIKGVTDVYGSGNDGEQFNKNVSILSQKFPDAIKLLIESENLK